MKRTLNLLCLFPLLLGFTHTYESPNNQNFTKKALYSNPWLLGQDTLKNVAGLPTTCRWPCIPDPK